MNIKVTHVHYLAHFCYLCEATSMKSCTLNRLLVYELFKLYNQLYTPHGHSSPVKVRLRSSQASYGNKKKPNVFDI